MGKRSARKTRSKKTFWALLPLALLPVGIFILLYFLSSSGPIGAMFARKSDVSTKIIGGSPVPSGKYPFQVAILQEGGTSYNRQFCGGSLITPRHVLTAAHCVYRKSSPEKIQVLIGRTKLNSKEGEIRNVSKISIHPQFSVDYDAAVLLLDAPVEGYAPIALSGPQEDYLEADGNVLTVIGWGSVKSDVLGSNDKKSKKKDKKSGKGKKKKGKQGSQIKNDDYPLQLRETTVPVVGDVQCDAAYSTGINFDVSVCAGTKKADSCYLDSGGPLFSRRPDGQFVQVGIVSWGRGCATPNFPGVYTEVNAPDIADFIRQETAN